MRQRSRMAVSWSSQSCGSQSSTLRSVLPTAGCAVPDGLGGPAWIGMPAVQAARARYCAVDRQAVRQPVVAGDGWQMRQRLSRRTFFGRCAGLSRSQRGLGLLFGSNTQGDARVRQFLQRPADAGAVRIQIHIDAARQDRAVVEQCLAEEAALPEVTGALVFAVGFPGHSSWV